MRLIAAITLYTLSSLTLAAATPDYCVGFTPDACKRIKAVIDSKKRPSYCVPGFGLADNGLNLTPEQLRICYAQPLSPIDSNTQSTLSERQIMLNQQINDARAMIKESWANYSNLIEKIETGYKCGVVDQISANVAAQNIQVAMQEEMYQAGLVNDPTMDVRKVATEAVQAGINAFESGASRVRQLIV